MTAVSNEALEALIHSGDRSAWATAALVIVLDGAGPPEQRAAAHDVLRVLGIDTADGLNPSDSSRIAAQAAAPLLQTAALLRGEGQLWAGQSDAALLAQGRASARSAGLFAGFVLPSMPGLAETLGRPGARMLDVGTGVAALAVAFAEHFPQLTVVGLDVLPRVLTLAEVTVAGSAVAERVVLREQDVGDLDEPDTYDLAWLPAPFVPEPALRRGVAAISRALVPGGWLMVGHGRYAGDLVDDSISRFKTVAYGGTALDDRQAEEMLRSSGFENVRSLPTPPGAPGITVGRRAPA